MGADGTQRVRERAYELWEQGGRQDGTSEQNWLRAERDCAAPVVQQEPRPATAPVRGRAIDKVAKMTEATGQGAPSRKKVAAGSTSKARRSPAAKAAAAMAAAPADKPA